MVVFNYSTRELTTKIVYYGPGLCGKTTNLQFIFDNMPQGVRGKMLSLATKSDRTLFFDFLPIDLGEIQGMKTKVQLYTVPGQVFYNETRRLVLKGSDGVVFVADSQENMLEANLDSFRNLEENLEAHGMDLATLPHVLQFNKQDLPNAMGVEQLNERLNRYNVPFYEAVATTGVGVQETLKHVTKLVLLHLNDRYAGGRSADASVAQVGRPAPAPVASAPEATAAPAPVASAPGATAAPAAAPLAFDPPQAPAAAASAMGSLGVAGAPAALATPPIPPAAPVQAAAEAQVAQQTLVDQPAVVSEEDSFQFDSAFLGTEIEADSGAADSVSAQDAGEQILDGLPDPPNFAAIDAPPALPAPPAEAPALSGPPALDLESALPPVPPPPAVVSADRNDVLGLAAPVGLSGTAAAARDDDDILEILPPAPQETSAPAPGGATIKIDRRDFAGMLGGAADPEALSPAAAAATATAVEVSEEDPLFKEPGVVPTRLRAGEPQEILVPLEIESAQGIKRLRLTLRLDLTQ